MKDLAQRAADVAQHLGGSYADARVVLVTTESIETKNGVPSDLSRATSDGIGVRALVDGAWGFSCTSELTPAGAEAAARGAVDLARASGRARTGPVRLGPAEAAVASYRTPYEVDPTSVPLSEKIDLLLAIDREMRAEPGLKLALGFMRFRKEKKWFASSEGSLLEQEIVVSGVGYQAVAADGSEIQVRSFPNTFRGQHLTRGYEMVRELPLVANARRVASEAVALLTAPQCPTRETTLVLGGSQLGLQIHESAGHPAELDRVLGSEMNYAGGSFLTLDKRGTLRYGSPMVTITADATQPGGLGTFGFDDEGVRAGSVDIVRDGVFVGYLSSRETAASTGLGRSSGAMRAAGWNRMPLVRMTNVSLAPGRGTLEDVVADTDEGILMDTNRSWSIDQLRLNFQFGTEIAWEIQKGRRTRMLRNPTYHGMTTEFWGSCDWIGGPQEWEMWGTPNCGKGQPGQTMFTGHGAAPARFRRVKVGVAYGR